MRIDEKTLPSNISRSESDIDEDYYQEKGVSSSDTSLLKKIAIGVGFGIVIIAGGVLIAWVVSATGILAAAGGALIGFFKFLGLSLAAATGAGLMSFLVQSAEVAWHHDWNQTDTDILREIESIKNALGGPVGEFIGRSLATLLVGSALQTPIIEVRARAVALAIIVNPSISDRLIDAFADILAAVKSAGASIFAKLAFLNSRALIRNTWNSLDDNIKGSLPGLNDFIDDWGIEERSSLIIAERVEERIENIENEFLRNALEEGLEVFFETLGDLLIEEEPNIRWV